MASVETTAVTVTGDENVPPPNHRPDNVVCQTDAKSPPTSAVRSVLTDLNCSTGASDPKIVVLQVSLYPPCLTGNLDSL